MFQFLEDVLPFIKAWKLPCSWLELKKPLGLEVTNLQVTETCPVAYDTALRITMTWMTENLYQHFFLEEESPHKPFISNLK